MTQTFKYSNKFKTFPFIMLRRENQFHAWFFLCLRNGIRSEGLRHEETALRTSCHYFFGKIRLFRFFPQLPASSCIQK
jgi:hypothetical protein